MKFDKNSLRKPWVAYTVATCSAVLLYTAVNHLHLVFRALHAIGVFAKPVILGVVFAYVLDPLVRLVEDKLLRNFKSRRIQRFLAVLLTVIFVGLLIAALAFVLTPQIVDSISMFLGNLNLYVRSLQLMLHRLSQTASNWEFGLSTLITNGDALLSQLTSVLPENITGLMANFFNIGRSFFEGFIAVILSFYLLADKDSLVSGYRRFMRAVIPPGPYERIMQFSSTCNVIMVRYLAFSLIDALIVGVANWIFMLIAGMPYAILVSVIVAVFNLAPTFGPIVGAILGAMFLFLVKPWYALWFLLFTLFIQTVDGYFIKPKLFGDQLGVPPVWILVSIIVGGRIFGVVGILLAIPLAAIADYAYQTLIIPKLEARREALNKEHEEQEKLKHEKLKQEEPKQEEIPS